jgi:RNA polymerase sigma factor (sigma-70 family)
MTPLISSTLLRTQTDGRLLELASAGHDRAFEAIVERYRRPLQRYLRRLLSESLAEDVLQATFLNAWSSLRAGTEVRDLKPWLYRIAHNGAINVLKRAGEALEEIPESVGDFTGPETELERRDEMRRTLRGVASLPSRQRAALLAVAVDGRAHSDIAAELGLTDGAVRQLVHRARTTLRTAATAVTPTPLLNVMLAGHDATVARVAEVAAGAGGAGAASLSLKAGAAAVLATGALVTGGPKMVDVIAPHHGAKPAVTAKATVAPNRDRAGRHDGSALAAPALVSDHRRRHQGSDDAKGNGAGGHHRHRHHGSGSGADDHGGDASSSGPSVRSGPPAVDDHGGGSGSGGESHSRGESRSGGERHHTRRHSGSHSGSGDDDAQHRHRHRGGRGSSGTSGDDDGAGLADDKGGARTRSGGGGADDGAKPSEADDHAETAPALTAPASGGGGGGGGGGDDAVTAPAPTVTTQEAAPAAPPADGGDVSGKLRAGDAAAGGSTSGGSGGSSSGGGTSGGGTDLLTP